MPGKCLLRARPVPFTDVTFGDGFWTRPIRLVRDVILPYQWQALNDRVPGVPKSHAVANFRRAAGLEKGEHGGYVFQDSDLAKWIEAAAYVLATGPDPVLAARVDDVVGIIAGAQQPDGYLDTAFILKDRDKRWTNLRDLHELYCAGHMMEAAVALYNATGNRKLLDVMSRNADHIASVLGRGRGRKRGYSGHPEIELALVKLYRATGDRRHLDLAAYLVDERGRSPNYFDIEARARGEDPARSWAGHDYYQAHAPVREQKTAEGHAVRACYLYAGMADVAAETGDRTLLRACKTLWDNIAGRRLYIHGGVGSSRFGERFTIDYDLPNEEAYAETCAAIALVLFAHRMLHLDPDGAYADVMEQALYNCILSGVSLDGTRFFYDNYLASVPGVHRFTQQKPPERQGWFGCACCPPNLARLFASLGQYIFSQTDREIAVHLYATCKAAVTLRGGAVEVEQRTGYPWKETVSLRIRPKAPMFFTLALRVPGWCRGALLRINGKPVKLAGRIKKGYVRIEREWKPGDRVDFRLPMPVERIEAHPRVRHDAGRVALRRGPVLYCLEEVDNGPALNAIRLPRRARLSARFEAGTLGGVVVVTGPARRLDESTWKGRLYRPAGQTRTRPVRIKAVPYAFWANRGPGEMLVWIPEA